MSSFLVCSHHLPRRLTPAPHVAICACAVNIYCRRRPVIPMPCPSGGQLTVCGRRLPLGLQLMHNLVLEPLSLVFSAHLSCGQSSPMRQVKTEACIKRCYKSKAIAAVLGLCVLSERATQLVAE